MIYTNGIYLMHKNNDEEELQDAIEKIAAYIKMHKGIDVEFPEEDHEEYKIYLVPKDVSYEQIYEALRPNVALKGINDEVLTDPVERVIEIEHIYTEEEKADLGLQLSNKIIDIRRLESEAKATAERYKSKIKDIKNDHDDLVEKVSKGKEYRPKNTIVKFNFQDNLKYFMDSENHDECIKVEDMSPSERNMQLTIDMQPEVKPKEEKKKDDPIAIDTEDDEEGVF